jgi:hypothetical protein
MGGGWTRARPRRRGRRRIVPDMMRRHVRTPGWVGASVLVVLVLSCIRNAIGRWPDPGGALGASVG